MVRVTITGAAGAIGRCLVGGLTAAGHDVRGIDRVPLDGALADRVVVADLATDDAALDDVLTGADAVVHLAAIAAETDFATALDTHLRLTHRVLEAMVARGVGRIVYASSNHAVGFTAHAESVPIATRARPDTFYGVGKAAAEALCSLYHDRHGIAVACLRIGSFRDRPTTRRHLATWLSHGDAVRLVDACLERAGPRLRQRVRDLRQPAGLVGPRQRTGPRVRPAGRRRAVGGGDRGHPADGGGRARRPLRGWQLHPPALTPHGAAGRSRTGSLN